MRNNNLKEIQKNMRSILLLMNVGKPAGTNSPIIERSYSYSLLLVFENKAAHDDYQIHPIHKSLLKIVLIYGVRCLFMILNRSDFVKTHSRNLMTFYQSN